MDEKKDFVEVEVVNEKKATMSKRKKFEIRRLVMSTYSVLIVIAYIVISLLTGYWHPTWVIFLSIPIADSAVSAILNKKIAQFSLELVAIVAFIVVGILTGKWHPAWLILLIIPLYRYILSTIKRVKKIKEMD